MKELKILKELKTAELKIQDLKERVQILDAIATRTTPTYSLASSAGAGNSKEDTMAKLIDLNLKLDKYRFEKEYALYAAERAIDALPEEQAQIIKARYKQALTWTQISTRLHLDRSTCFRLHNKAIDKLIAAGLE